MTTPIRSSVPGPRPEVQRPRPVEPPSARPARAPEKKNWNGVVKFTPGVVIRPRTEADLVAAIMSHPKVRLAGARHSMNRSMAADPQTAHIDMTGLNRIGVPFQEEDGQWAVWVEAGATVQDISAQLARHGKAFASLPTSEKITIGGAIANGVHGSGFRAPAVISEQVTGLEIITHRGRKVTVPEDVLPLARVGIGSLGATYRVKLRVVDNFQLLGTEDVAGTEVFATAHILSTLQRHDHALYMYDPGSGRVVRRFLDRITTVAQRRVAATAQRKTDYEHSDFLGKLMETVLFGPVGKIPLINLYERLALKMTGMITARPPRVGEARFMFQDNYTHPSHDTSFGIPLERTQETLARLSDELKKLGYQPVIPVAVRFLKGSDRTRLAMSSGRDTAMIEMAAPVEVDGHPVSRRAREQAQAVFERVMLEAGGRPHWGKEFTINPREQYPAEDWEEFGRLSEAWGGTKFQNEWALKLTPARKARNGRTDDLYRPAVPNDQEVSRR